jgi:hypothetical protein
MASAAPISFFNERVDPLFLPDLHSFLILWIDLDANGVNRNGIFLLDFNPVLLDVYIQCHTNILPLLLSGSLKVPQHVLEHRRVAHLLAGWTNKGNCRMTQPANEHVCGNSVSISVQNCPPFSVEK